MMTDPIADMLTRIRNGISAGKEKIDIPASKMKAGICKVMKCLRVISKDLKL